MPTYSSQDLINSLEQQTEQILQTAIQEWQMICRQTFTKQPKEGSWSANECLQHLNSYGDYYLPAIEKAIADTSSGSNAVFVSGRLGGYFTKMMQPGEDGQIKKMKAPSNHSPKGIQNSGDVIAKFIDQQEKILALLESARKVDLNKVRVPISIAKFIRLKLGDVFMFLIAHNNRHVLQAQKAIECTVLDVRC
jgi:hypothetical protein